MRPCRHLGQLGRSMAEMCAGGTGSNSGITHHDGLRLTSNRPDRQTKGWLFEHARHHDLNSGRLRTRMHALTVEHECATLARILRASCLPAAQSFEAPVLRPQRKSRQGEFASSRLALQPKYAAWMATPCRAAR